MSSQNLHASIGPPPETVVSVSRRRSSGASGSKRGQATASLDADPDRTRDVPSAAAAPDADLVEADRRRLLEDGLARLPDAMREVVVLHDLQGLSHEQIAHMMDEAATAVRKRYSRALARLREIMQAHRPDVLE